MNSRKVFGVSTKRLEDPDLITGNGQFIDDIHFPGLKHAAFLRSPHGHALVKEIKKETALKIAGVHAVFTLSDFRPHLANERLIVGLPSSAYRQDINRPALASEEVVHVGEPIAIVIADSRYIAEDAVAHIDIEYELLPVVSDCATALKPDAPTTHKNSPNNILAEFDVGYGDVDKAFNVAPHIFRENIWQHRGGSHSIEGRGSVASFDEYEEQVVLWTSTQAAHTAKSVLVDMLGWSENRIRVITPDVGGGFGPKVVFYQEDVAVVMAAILLRQPIKWVEDRREHFVGTTQERDQYWDVEIALDEDATILGIRGSLIHDHGAYTARGINLAQNSAVVVPLPYNVPTYHLDVKLVLTNKVPVTPVRGAGHPQGIFVMERLLDRAAQEFNLDPTEVRYRNLVQGEDMPCEKPIKARNGLPVVLDSGDYPACMAKALDAANYGGFLERQGQALGEGRYIGIGVANYVKGTGRGPFESATVRIGPSGKILVYTGAASMGQSTKTMMAQIVAEQLGGDMTSVEVITGDTAGVPMGIGGSASRQTVTVGNSVHLAAISVREKAFKVAAHMLEASEDDLEFVDGEIRVKGVAELNISLGKVAHAVGGTPGFALPGGIEPGMEATKNFVIDELAFANGTQVVEVEVDPEIGEVSFLNYVMVHDSGVIINPMIVDGQVIGGTAHGIGNTLYEWMGYDENAQPLTTNFAEYLLVTAPEVPTINLIHVETPTPLNPLGVKGVGECGIAAASAAIVAAIENALTPFGVHIDQVPIRPAEIVKKVIASR